MQVILTIALCREVVAERVRSLVVRVKEEILVVSSETAARIWVIFKALKAEVSEAHEHDEELMWTLTRGLDLRDVIPTHRGVSEPIKTQRAEILEQLLTLSAEGLLLRSLLLLGGAREAL